MSAREWQREPLRKDVKMSYLAYDQPLTPKEAEYALFAVKEAAGTGPRSDMQRSLIEKLDALLYPANPHCKAK